jgi:PAS domain S-box-containing protein
MDMDMTIEQLRAENEALRQRLAQAEQERDEAQAAQQQMRNVLMQAPLPVFLLHGPHHTYELANPAYLKMVQKSDVLGKPVREVFPELEGQGYFEVLDTIRASGEGLIQQEFPATIERGSDGTLEQGWFNLVYQPIRDTHGTVEGILHMVQEVTDQVRARHQVEQLNTALYQSRNLLQSVIDNYPSVIYAKDLEGRLILANEAFVHFIGMEKADLIGKTDFDYFPHEVAERVRVFDQQVLAGGVLVRSEDELPTEEGTLFYDTVKFPIRNEQGTVYALGGISTDITARKRQEEELRIFKSVIEAAPDGVVLTNLETGQIFYANLAYRTMMGYGDEIIGLPMRNIHTESPERLQELIQQSVDHGVLKAELGCRRKDGTTFLASLSGIILRSPDGQLLVSAGILRDLTEQQQAEAERAALQQQVIEAQREALRELSTPLIPIAENVVIMPLIGTIDSQRAQMIMEALLEGIAHHQADLAILDITGVAVVDTQVAQALIQTAQAVKLLGARVMLTGIQPQIAQTLVHLGTDLGGIITRGSLQSGIAAALHEGRGPTE